MDAPCADIWELENGKIKKFDCYPEGSVLLAQLSVISYLESRIRLHDRRRPSVGVMDIRRRRWLRCCRDLADRNAQAGKQPGRSK